MHELSIFWYIVGFDKYCAVFAYIWRASQGIIFCSHHLHSDSAESLDYVIMYVFIMQNVTMSIISHVYTFHVYITCLLYILYICFFAIWWVHFFLSVGWWRWRRCFNVDPRRWSGYLSSGSRRHHLGLAGVSIGRTWQNVLELSKNVSRNLRKQWNKSVSLCFFTIIISSKILPLYFLLLLQFGFTTLVGMGLHCQRGLSTAASSWSYPVQLLADHKLPSGYD